MPGRGIARRGYVISRSPFRELFPSADRGLHLDHAGVSPISTPVVDAIGGFLQEALVVSAQSYPYWELRAEEVRAACARLAGAESRQVAFVKNTSEALSFVASGLDWRAGDVVVTVDEEFPSNIYPWWDLQRIGVETRMLPARAVVEDLGAVDAALDRRARVLAVSAVAYGTGDLRPWADLAELCRKRDVLLIVDAIQALGAVEMNLGAEGLDCVAADGHKWMCAPEGAGFMAVSDRLLDRLRPVELGWKSVVESGNHYPYHFRVRSDAAKLEAGSLNLMALYGLGAAVELALEASVAQIERRIADLTDAYVDGLRERGCRLLGARASGGAGRRSGIVTFEPKSAPERLRQELWARGVVCKVRLGGLRLAPHHYQDESDVTAFFERLDDAERILS